MLRTHLLLALLWITFCALHSILASIRVKDAIAQHSDKFFRYYRLAYTLFAFLSMTAIIWYEIVLPTTNVFTSTMIITTIGYLVAAAGFLLMAICIRKYFMGLSGLRALFIPKPSASLQIRGVHRYVRHPLYLGTFIFLWGMWLVMPLWSILISNAIITVYTIAAIPWEEAKLIREFGDDYRKYQQSVPMLQPRLRLRRKGMEG